MTSVELSCRQTSWDGLENDDFGVTGRNVDLRMLHWAFPPFAMLNKLLGSYLEGAPTRLV